MNRIRRLRRSLACLPRRAGALAAFAAAPAAWRPDSPFPPGWKLPSGWNDYLDGLKPAPASVAGDMQRRRVYFVAVMALHAAEDKANPGASVAGLAWH